MTVEGRKLTTNSTFGAAFEFAGPRSASHVLPTPVLGSMPGMNMSGMNMSGMSMPGMKMAGLGRNEDLPLIATLRSGDASRGASLFRDHSCSQCHGAGGAGGGSAPALVGAAGRLPPE